MKKEHKREAPDSCFRLAEELRQTLHEMPEASGCERKTAAFLKGWLAARIREKKETDGAVGTDDTGSTDSSGIFREQTKATDRIIDHGKWFYLLHQEPEAGTCLAFRADMDAVTGPDGVPYHGCGHDGHSSVMAALACSVLGKTTGKNLLFLFQHAEETGEGAGECLKLFEDVQPEMMFAFHNIPGYPEGAVLEREETFACASKGLCLGFRGKQSHAAYPELGKNPVYVLGKLIGKLPEITAPEKYSGMIRLTPVYLNAGARAFGVAAGEGELCFTLRAWKDGDLKALQERLLEEAGKLAEEAGIRFSAAQQDVFAATVNHREALEMVRKAARENGLKELQLPEPMRWSEDFGRFGAGCKTCMVGIGAGEAAPGLHTPEYFWNPAVTRAALQLFSGIIFTKR